MNKINNEFLESSIFISWYEKNMRKLPWRETEEPYFVWISEIMLQQTRVIQGMEYYQRFVKRFPKVEVLAAASEAEVLKYWQGLGYYSRARHLHEAAKDIMIRFGGHFPQKYEDILSLKGVGGYTAAAIVSIAWNRPYPVVDGNVFRVLGRLFAVDTPVDTTEGKKRYAELAHRIMDPAQAGRHNQAVMEFGALQCTPQNPACSRCPLMHQCAGYAGGDPQRFPVKRRKVKTRERYFHFLYIIYNNVYVYLHRRDENDIWRGLFELPVIETAYPADFAELKNLPEFKKLFLSDSHAVFTPDRNSVRHVLTHQVLYVTFCKVEIRTESEALKAYLKIPLHTLDDYPVPILIHRYLESVRK
ncbi:MAG: A/G-specific adenine glycosylase [Tannerella sp.]|jgi:A/G-specific adenine glycosylase|nr:A/G-specific adenine glycosylase [Tannerella sp.]